MRVRVLREVKWDGRRHGPGAILDVPLGAAGHWIRHGLAEPAEEPEPEPEPAEATQPEPEPVEATESEAKPKPRRRAKKADA